MKYRRLREFCLRVLAAQKRGLRQEADERESRRTQESRELELQANRRSHNETIHKALTVDKKWIREVFA